ncbi:unnamed protein product [Lactuca virosa]|uniref:DUF4283 domain-containing protein n=1 Tax=Lactuca virosa TaxID=75947 RepID=A0AAU9M3M5_9ASTR|nr:unnamed protein product [Lactuca virosa]
MATKKDIHRKNFAFVRFKGVDDEMRLENSLQGLKCMGSSLEVNVAIFERREVTRTKRNITENSLNPPRKPTDAFCDGRSFAAVTSGVFQGLVPPPPPSTLTNKPIRLEGDSFWAHWVLSPLTLIGVARSLEHLRNLAVKYRLGQEFAYGMKYMGGLSVGIRFRNSAVVKQFLLKKEQWGKWFSEFKVGSSYDGNVERIAWLKVVGLPLHMWSEENFSRIARWVGQPIGPLEIPLSMQDVSHGKICVLTSRKTKINDEVLVKLKGNVQKMGLVEENFDWPPFPVGLWISEEPCRYEDDGSAFIDDDGDNRAGGENLEDENMNKGLDDEELEEGELRYDEDIRIARVMSTKPLVAEDEPLPETRTQIDGTQGLEDVSTEVVPRNGEDQSFTNINCQREGISFIFNAESSKEKTPVAP